MIFKPADGDVVVRSHAAGNGSSGLRYTLRVQGDPEQFSELTYEIALNRADSFARHMQIDVWYTEDDIAFRRMTRHRGGTSIG